jgi:hypothetical protein
LLLVLDNLETLLTPDGQWRDRRWALLISALTGHQGPSRVILTCRIVPSGLNPDTVLIWPVQALSRDESLSLIGQLPNLRALLHSVALGRCVLTLTQGHPTLLELADAAAADPPRLAYQLAEIEAAVDGAAPLIAFLTDGRTRLDAEQLSQTFTTWVLNVAATLPTRARLLLQALCRIEETDRNTTVVGANWAALWRRWEQPGEPPPLASPPAALVGAALIATDPIGDPADPYGPVRYRIHPGIARVIHGVTPESVTAAVDAQLAAWRTAVVGGWGIEQPPSGKDASQFMVRASLAAARYLLRQRDWNVASCLLERALIREDYSPATSLAVTALLAHRRGHRRAQRPRRARRRSPEGGCWRGRNPAAPRLPPSHDRRPKYQLASTTAGELVTLLRDQGRLREALTLAGQKIEHTGHAGFGFWTQLSDKGRRLQILNLLGDHEQVLNDLPVLRAHMADLSDQRARNDRVNPRNVREGVLDIGRMSAVALERCDDALDLNDEITSTKRRSGATPYEIACTRFNNYLPLLHLGRLTDADQLLRECHDAFDTAADITQLAVVHGARADLKDKRNHPVDAVELQRTSLQLWYVHPDPREIATAHHNLANYLARAAGTPAEQRAHRLTAAFLNHLTGNMRKLTGTLAMLVSELRGDASSPDAPALPTTLPEVTRLVDANDGVRFGQLAVTLCPDPATAEQALADLLTTAATCAQQSLGRS